MPLYSRDEAVLTGLQSDDVCGTAETFLAYLSPQHRRWAWVKGDFN
jgi:hypothetical protein